MSKKLVDELMRQPELPGQTEAVHRVGHADPGLISHRLAFYAATGNPAMRDRAVALARMLGLSLSTQSSFAGAKARGEEAVWHVRGRLELSPSHTRHLASLVPPPLSPVTDHVTVDLSDASLLEPFALAAIACRRPELLRAGMHLDIRTDPDVGANAFAFALGLPSLWTTGIVRPAKEKERTHPVSMIKTYAEMEKFALDVAARVSPDDDEVRKATKYCLVELIRNVIDHSGSEAYVCAQRMDAGRGLRKKEHVQVAVADCGLGLRQTLSAMHEWVSADSIAIAAAMSPLISRTFPGGRYDLMKDNAGLGLHFVSELVRRSDGRFLLWSGNHARIIIGDPDSEEGAQETEIAMPHFSGTLAAFEFEIGLIEDFAEFFAFLREQVEKLVLAGKTGSTVLTRNSEAEGDAPRIGVLHLKEDTSQARAYRREVLIPRVRSSRQVIMDFRSYHHLSPSFAHALMHETIREASLANCNIVVANADDAVWDALAQVETYALAIAAKPL
ncbi:MAG: hypothetical protein U0234_12510 [Sandaracinus sp.]